MEVISIENRYFLVRFASVEDYEFAKYDPLTDKTENVIVWFRFPCLSAEYYNHDFLMKVGAKVGKPITIDTATSLVSRAMFARVCVEVDILKPLLSKFMIRRKVRKVVYEGLHLICFKCGMYGHGAEACPQNHKETNVEEVSEVHEARA